MAKSRNDILFRFLGDTKDLDKANRSAQSSFKTTQGASDKLMGALKGLAVAFGAREVLQFANDSIQLAIAADEVDSKFKAVFGTANDLTAELQELGDKAGIADDDLRDLAATFGNLAMAQGISKDDTEELTILVGELAADLASFNDADPEEVFFDLNKALLTTEREGMKKYGISLAENEIKQRALEIATAEGRTEFTKADKALASYQLAVEQSGKAVGDLDRTSDSLANRQRRLKADTKDLQTEFGKQLLPAYEQLISASEKLMPVVGALSKKIGGLAESASDATSDIGWLVGAISDYVNISPDAIDETSSLARYLGYAGDAAGFLTGNIIDATWGLGKYIAVNAVDSVRDLNEELSAQDEDMIRLQKSLAEAAVSAKGFYESEDEIGFYAQQAGKYLGDEFAGGIETATSQLWEMDEAQKAAYDSMKTMGDYASIFSGAMFEVAESLAAANRESVDMLFAGGGGSGQTADPVSTSQQWNDTLAIGSQTGG